MSERKLTEENINQYKEWAESWKGAEVHLHFQDSSVTHKHSWDTFFNIPLRLLHDLELADAELEEYKKGYWGNPCEKHQKIEAWIASVKIDDEGLHCFGCFLETRSLPLEAENERLRGDVQALLRFSQCIVCRCSFDDNLIDVEGRVQCPACVVTGVRPNVQTALEEEKPPTDSPQD